MNSGPARRSVAFVGADADYMYRFRLPLIQELQRRGYRAVVIAAVPEGFDPSVFSKAGVEAVDWPLRRGGLNPLRDLKELILLWRILRVERPYILFAHGAKPVIYAMLVGAAAKVSRRVAMIPGLGYAFIPGRGTVRTFARLAGTLGYRMALRRAHAVIFQNPDDRQVLVNSGAIRRGEQGFVVNGSGIDMKLFSYAPLPAAPLTFLMVSRLLRDKGVYEFVEAAQLVKQVDPEVRFVLAGSSDPQNPAAVDQAQVVAWAEGGTIEPLGHVPDPRPQYRDCHVFVLPSYREGTPRTNLEAMATGRAIITSDAPGCRETVEHGVTGLLVPPGDPKALAAAMLEFTHNPDSIRRMGEAGLARCRQRYELGAVTSATADIVEGQLA